MGRPAGSNNKGSSSRKRTGGAAKKTKQKAKPRGSVNKAGAAKKTISKQKAKPRGSVKKAVTSKKTSAKQTSAKPPAKVPKKDTSKNTNTAKQKAAKPPAKVPNKQGASKTNQSVKIKWPVTAPNQVTPRILNLPVISGTMQKTPPPTIVHNNQVTYNYVSPPQPVPLQLEPMANERKVPAQKRKNVQPNLSSAPDSEGEGPDRKRRKVSAAEPKGEVVTFKEGKPTDQELDELAGKVAPVWKPLGIHLGIEQDVLDEIQANEPDKPKAMLLRWRNTTDSDTPYQELYKALCHRRVGLDNLAKDICGIEVDIQEASVTNETPAPKKLKQAVRAGSPSYDELEKLALDVSPFWKQLGRRLGINEARLIGFEVQNREVSEQAYKMLRHWKESRAQDATYSVLFKALSDDRVSQSDLAVKYCCP